MGKLAHAPKKRPLSKLKKDLWQIFSAYIKLRGRGICFTCGRYCEGANSHCGHFIKASICGIELYFHEDNNHVQCAYCNIWLDGNQYEYGMKLGKKTVDKLKKIRQKTKGKTWDRQKYEKMISHYSKLLEQTKTSSLGI